MLVLVLSIIAVLVSFNTIRMAIFTMREEIGIMRLVGAARWFIRGPFLVSGVLYGASAALLTLLIFFPLVWLISPRLILLMPSFDLFQYFLLNFFEFAAARKTKSFQAEFFCFFGARQCFFGVAGIRIDDYQTIF